MTADERRPRAVRAWMLTAEELLVRVDSVRKVPATRGPVVAVTAGAEWRIRPLALEADGYAVHSIMCPDDHPLPFALLLEVPPATLRQLGQQLVALAAAVDAILAGATVELVR